MTEDSTEPPVVIASIAPLAERPDRARVELTDGRCFEIEQSHPDRDVLRPGLDARRPPVDALLLEHRRREIRTKALDLLGRRDHLSTELRRRLSDEPTELVVGELDALREDGWLDDLAVARRRTERWRSEGRSLQDCRRRLETAGLDGPTIDEALGGEDQDVEAAALGRLVERRHGSLENLDATELRRLAARWARRGFDLETIRRVLREYDASDSALEPPGDGIFQEDDA